jgi:hypothetical protein
MSKGVDALFRADLKICFECLRLYSLFRTVTLFSIPKKVALPVYDLASRGLCCV